MTAPYEAGGTALPGRHGLPTSDLPSRPARPGGLVREVRTAREVPRLLLRAPRLARVPRGDGGPVLDLPGWRTSEASLAPLRSYLRWLGHDARPWGLGRNLGDPMGDAARMAGRVTDLAAAAGRPVALVGWSLGGLVARETARRAPDAVAQVITFGSPIVGGPAYTAFTSGWPDARRRAWVRRVAEAEAADPLRCRVTTIFSRADAVVPWLASLDHHSADVRHIQVRSTHLGLGVDPDVWEIVARSLADDRTSRVATS
jgi:pimeloyl-ACP methyl ester carboxylesterase